MAKKNIGTLGAKITADTTDFNRKVGEARKGVETFSTGARGAIGKLSSAMKTATAAAGAIAAALAIRQLWRGFEGAVTAVQSINDMANATGLLTSTYQELVFAAKLVGEEHSTFDAALLRLTRNVGEANNQNQRSVDLFAQLGVQLKDTSGALRSQDDVVVDVFKNLAEMADETERTRLATDLLGRSGATLLQVGNDFDTVAQRAREMGIVIGDSVIQQGIRAKQVLTTLQAAFTANLTTTFIEMAPAIEALGGAVIKHMPDIVWWLSEFLNTDVADRGTASIDRRIAKIREELEELIEVQQRIQRGEGTLLESFGTGPGPEIIRLRREIAELEEIRVEAARREAELHAESRANALTRQKEANDRIAKTEADAAAERLQAINEQLHREESARNTALARQAENYVEAWRDAQDATRALFRQRDAIQANPFFDEEEVKAALMEVNALILEAKHQRDRGFTDADQSEADRIRAQLDPLHAVAVQIERINELKALGLLSDELAQKAIDELNESLKDTNKFAQDLSFSFTSAFENAVLRGEKLRDVLKGILEDIVRIMMRSLITQPLGDALTAGLGSVFGGGGAGGKTLQPGMVYPVGERGPELITTASPGRVLNNNASRHLAGGSNSPVKVTFVNQGTPQQQVSSSSSSGPDGIVVQVVLDDLRRGGPIANGLSNNYGLRRQVR